MTPSQFEDFNAADFKLYCEQRFKRIELTDDRQNQLVGLLCSVIANFSMTKKKGKNYKASDFINLKKEKVRLTPDEIAKKLEHVTRRLNGDVNK